MTEITDSRVPRLKIGEMSKRTGCKVETIRYYERIGMPPPRGAGGHRHYGGDQVKRLNFILRARGLGFPLDAVRALLGLADGDENTCAGVVRIAAAHLDDVRAKLSDLAALVDRIQHMVPIRSPIPVSRQESARGRCR